MSKGILEFDLEDYEQRKAFERAVKADKAFAMLERISSELFRPARKHGYRDSKLEAILDTIESSEWFVNEDEHSKEGYNVGVELVGRLEALFYEMLEEDNLLGELP